MPDGSGLILVVGPSGVGKDSVIAAARHALGHEVPVAIARRIVTRGIVDGSEDHDVCSEIEFADRARRGAFALHWRANGLCYALSRSIEAALGTGVVIANVSRGILDEAQRRYPGLAVCLIQADRHIVEARLRARRRETDAEILARLDRAAAFDLAGPDIVRIDNSGPLPIAASALAAIVADRLSRSSMRDPAGRALPSPAARTATAD